MRVHRIATAVTALAAILSASLPARATTYIWTGDGSSNSWYSADNWEGGTGPLDGPPSYVFAASDWNTAQTTIAIDGANRNLDAQTLTFNGNASLPLTIQIGSSNSLCLSPSSSGATTISVAQTSVKYTIAGSSGASVQLNDDQQWSVDGALEISAVIWGESETPAPGFVKTGAGTLILSGNNSFSGPISIDQGVISISTIAAKGQACNLGRGDLTLNGGVLTYTGTTPNVSTNRGFTLGAGGGTIDVQNAATSLTFTDAVTGGQAGLTKTGSGTLTLGAASTYTGPTVVGNGTLQINGATSATNVLASAGGANVTGGFLVLDYSASGTSVGSTVQSLLKTAYNNGTNSFQTGQLRDTGATSSIGLGWVDNTSTKQVTVMPAMYGDANLDGTVGLADLNTLLTNYGKSSMAWSQGDFTYDGTVGLADLNALLTNYGKSGPLQIASAPYSNLDSQALQLLARDGITFSGVTAVPEPSNLVMLASLLALGGAWGIRRRNRGERGGVWQMMCTPSKYRAVALSHASSAPQCRSGTCNHPGSGERKPTPPGRKYSRFRPHGFTLLELLVVITITGILLAVLLPAVQARARPHGDRRAHNHLKQIGLAILNFESAYKKLPAGGEGTDWPSKSSTFSIQSLFTYLLPFVERIDTYNSMDLTKSYRDVAGAPQNVAAAKAAISVYVCPSNPFSQQTDPAGFGGLDYFATAWTDIDPVTGIRNRATRAGGALATLDGSNNPVTGAADGTSSTGMALSAVIDGASNTFAVIEDAGRVSPDFASELYYTPAGYFDSFSGTLSTATLPTRPAAESPLPRAACGPSGGGRIPMPAAAESPARPMPEAFSTPMATTWAK